jgi:hypothetical protein
LVPSDIPTIKTAESKEAERTFVLVRGLESETPSSNLYTKNKLVLFNKDKILSLIDGYMTELKHRTTIDSSFPSELSAVFEQKLHLSRFLRHCVFLHP